MSHIQEQQSVHPDAPPQLGDAAAQEPPRTRRPYVKPVLAQLRFMRDEHVSLAAGCKTSGSVSGATISGCRNASGSAPCVTTAS